MRKLIGALGVLALVVGIAAAQDENRRPPDRGDRGPDRPGPRGPGGRPGFAGGAFRPGQLLPGFLQDRLKLTAEQKKEVEELQKDVDAKLKEAHTKLDKILTDDQKKQLREMRERFAGLGGPPGGPGGRRPRFAGGPPRPGQVLPGFLQERLKLTAEQKKEVEELQKDVDAKLGKILTDDQKKQLREMGERFGRRGGPGRRPSGPGGDRPPRPPSD
jgi:hypothetical protein